jgi:hypothetical protein
MAQARLKATGETKPQLIGFFDASYLENDMAARSIASLTLSFGLVSIPVKLFSATDSTAGVGFNLLTPEGGRVKQQYIS